jgi:hypothetical protein
LYETKARGCLPLQLKRLVDGISAQLVARAKCRSFENTFISMTTMSVLSVVENNENMGMGAVNFDLLVTVSPNVVQSIRAFRVTELQQEAARLGQHFLYAHCAHATTRHQVLSIIANAFHFPRHLGKNLDVLEECLTSLPYKCGQQPGFLIVIEQLPNTPKFDKEARESLLDVFRDAADFWAAKKVPFRVFYSFQ